MAERKFTCELCEGEFITTMPKEEVMQKFVEEFPGEKDDDIMSLCEECYQDFMENFNAMFKGKTVN